MVEDNPGDIRLIEKAFEGSPVDMSTVENGEDALEFLLKEAGTCASGIDLVLLDLKLPNKNGEEVLEEIRDEPRLNHVPVIILTSSEDEDDVVEMYERGANAYLTKPVSFEGFVKMAEEVEGFWLETAELPI